MFVAVRRSKKERGEVEDLAPQGNAGRRYWSATVASMARRISGDAVVAFG